MNLEKKFEIGLRTINVKPILEYKKYIDSFFIGLPFFSNCRSNYILLDYLEKLISDCSDTPIWVTLNQPYISKKDIIQTADTAIGLYKTFKFHGFIVADLVMAQIFKNSGIPVQISTVTDIRDLNDIARYQEMEFNRIVLSYKVNRNLDLIEDACKQFPNMKFILIADELCESNCPYRLEHFCATCNSEYPAYECPIRNPENSFEWCLRTLQNTCIPPENLEHYPKNIIFKLPTRMPNFGEQDIIELLQYYIGEKPYKNYMELFKHHLNISQTQNLEIDRKVFEKWLVCKNQCYKCKICENELNRIFPRKN